MLCSNWKRVGTYEANKNYAPNVDAFFVGQNVPPTGENGVLGAFYSLLELGLRFSILQGRVLVRSKERCPRCRI